MKFVKLVFEEHICHINHKETSITLSATSRIWRETSRALYLPRMTSPEVAIALYFLPNRGFSQSERGKISIHVINLHMYHCNGRTGDLTVRMMVINILPFMSLINYKHCPRPLNPINDAENSRSDCLTGKLSFGLAYMFYINLH